MRLRHGLSGHGYKFKTPREMPLDGKAKVPMPGTTHIINTQLSMLRAPARFSAARAGLGW